MQWSRGSHDAQLSGTRDCGDMQWMLDKGGLGDEGLHRTFVWVELPFFPPCWLFMQTGSNQVEIWLHTDNSSFNSWLLECATHLNKLLNTGKLYRHFKMRLETTMSVFSKRVWTTGVLDCWLKFERVHFCQTCNKTTLSEISQKGHQRMKDMPLISYHLLSLWVLPLLRQIP